MAVALIVAAGSGARLGAGRPKALIELAGKPLVQWSVDALLESQAIEQVVVAMPQGEPAPPGTVGVTGGESRSQSVLRALQAAAPAEIVLVHDAARPLLSPALAEGVIAALESEPDAEAAIAAAPVTDTIKRAGPDGGAVMETLDRSELWGVQTPQVFRRAALEQALDVESEVLAQASDDAWLIERAGGRVIVVPGLRENLKVTTPLDLRVAALLLEERERLSAGPGAVGGDPA
jgi:2-C-methyl-D-erythritol 4-phosphate cytidylyltransferase